MTTPRSRTALLTATTALAVLLLSLLSACDDSPGKPTGETETSDFFEFLDLDQPECSSGAQCASGVCDTALGLCLEPSCADNVKNGDETGVDCGGACNPCGDDQECRADADCLSGNCDNLSHLCVAPSCEDERLNGGETDVDCGGSC
ncbi:MAG: hypothetical protein RBU37_23570, partial [Myxococcota bacterium]|nr:hypothetical protein [Myxococcota bacterium]